MKSKIQWGRFVGALLVPLFASIVQPLISSVVKDISGRWIRRAEDILLKLFSSTPTLRNIEFTKYFKDLKHLKHVSRNKLYKASFAHDIKM